MTLAEFDMTFVGHVCYDELTPYGGETVVSPGSAVLCGAAVAQRVGMRTAVVTRLHPSDEAVVTPLKDLGVDVFATPAEATTYVRVVHPSENVDERQLSIPQDAGFMAITDIPTGLQSGIVHLAGISDHEFSVDFIRRLHGMGYRLSLDMQSFVRAIAPNREIVFSDFPAKREVVPLLDVVKLDVVEAEILTGTRDLAEAARIFAEWGGKEVLITEKAGATLAVDGQILREPFSNRSQVGRTGRGDTTISAYLSRRRTHGPAEALRFAAALVSIKMEAPGPFSGTLADVEARMAECHT